MDSGDFTQIHSYIDEQALNNIINKFGHLNEMIEKESLRGVHLMRSLLDGKDICEIYKIKPGKAIKFIVEEQIRR